MKNAKELEVIATQAQIDRKITETNKARVYAEGIIEPILEETAKRGRRKVVLTKPDYIEWNVFKDYLEQHGFTVHSNIIKENGFTVYSDFSKYTICW